MMPKYLTSLALIAFILGLLTPQPISARRGGSRRRGRQGGCPEWGCRGAEEIDEVEAHAIHSHSVNMVLANTTRALVNGKLPVYLDLDQCPITSIEDVYAITQNCGRDLIGPLKYGVQPVPGARCKKTELDDLEECALAQNITLGSRQCLEEWDDVAYNALCEAYKSVQVVKDCIVENVDFSGRLAPEVVVAKICEAKAEIKTCVRSQHPYAQLTAPRIRHNFDHWCELVEMDNDDVPKGRSRSVELDPEVEDEIDAQSKGLALAGLHRHVAGLDSAGLVDLNLDDCSITSGRDLFEITETCARDLVGSEKYSFRRPLGITPVPGARCTKPELDDLEQCATGLPYITNATRQCLDDWDDIAYNALCEGYKAIFVIRDCVKKYVAVVDPASSPELLPRLICTVARHEIEECVHEQGVFAPTTGVRIQRNFEEYCKNHQFTTSNPARKVIKGRRGGRSRNNNGTHPLSGRRRGGRSRNNGTHPLSGRRRSRIG